MCVHHSAAETQAEIVTAPEDRVHELDIEVKKALVVPASLKVVGRRTDGGAQPILDGCLTLLVEAHSSIDEIVMSGVGAFIANDAEP